VDGGLRHPALPRRPDWSLGDGGGDRFIADAAAIAVADVTRAPSPPHLYLDCRRHRRQRVQLRGIAGNFRRLNLPRTAPPLEDGSGKLYIADLQNNRVRGC